MTITFHCEHCRELVQAADEAGGRRGKCPHCQGSNFVPLGGEVDPVDLAPLDETEEQQRRREVEALIAAERELLAESAPVETSPRLAERDSADIKPEDLHHLVVNYSLDMANGRLERAETHVQKLNQHQGPNRLAVSDFLTGKVLEPALDGVPVKVLQGFLTNLQQRML